DITQETLDATPGRVLLFLRGVGTSPIIRGALAAAGYKPADHDEGWQLLHKTSGYSTQPEPEDDSASRAAAQVDAWDEPTFRRTNLALARRFPDQRDFVFENKLEPATGAASLVSVSTFLDRLDALENGLDRKATRKKDHAALALLAERGITPDVRK